MKCENDVTSGKLFQKSNNGVQVMEIEKFNNYNTHVQFFQRFKVLKNFYCLQKDRIVSVEVSPKNTSYTLWATLIFYGYT